MGESVQINELEPMARSEPLPIQPLRQSVKAEAGVIWRGLVILCEAGFIFILLQDLIF